MVMKSLSSKPFMADETLLAESNLCFFIVVLGDLLKLIDGDETGLVCLVQISEYLLQSNRRIADFSKAHAPNRQSVDVE